MRIKYITPILLSTSILFTLGGCAKIAQPKKKINIIQNSKLSIKSISMDSIQRTKVKKVFYGKAGFYDNKFNGKKTASGEIYDMYAQTASHRTLPFNTIIRVTDMVSKKTSIVRINDRHPIINQHIIELSYASAKELGLIYRGTTDVKIEVIGLSKKKIKLSRPLPISKKVCVGNSCRATFAQIDNNISNLVEPFSLLSKNENNNSDISYFTQSDSEPFEYFPKIDNFFEKTSIQVGAFRRYAGAKVYAKRYSLLNDKYKTVIKNEIKNARPIYRVRIEGFQSEDDAKEFMFQYNLNGAFLVRR